MLEPAQLADLVAEAAEIGLDVLLEVHDEREVEMALQVPVELVGINNRDLRTFSYRPGGDPNDWRRAFPPSGWLVAESGIASRADVLRLQTAGAKFFLIGECLMRSADIGAKLGELLTGLRSLWTRKFCFRKHASPNNGTTSFPTCLGRLPRWSTPAPCSRSPPLTCCHSSRWA